MENLKQIPLLNIHVISDEEWNELAYKNLIERKSRGYTTMSTENITTNNEYELNEIIDNSLNELEKAIFMLDGFVDTYDWNIEPTWEKAMKYATTTDISNCSKDEEISYKLLTEYDNITKTIKIARDYCYNILDELQKKDK